MAQRSSPSQAGAKKLDLPRIQVDFSTDKHSGLAAADHVDRSHLSSLSARLS